MIFWLAGAFAFGILTPFTARRFSKFMPATFAGAIFELLRREKKVSQYRHIKQYKKLMWRSFMIGLLNIVLTGLVMYKFRDFPFIAVCIWLLLLLAEIDIRSFLLPDILTIPLLLLGLLASYIGKGVVSSDVSIYGAIIGYFLPVVVSLLIVWYKKDAFGGGDIKLLAAIGAWLGTEGLLYVITLSSVLGLLWALLRHKNSLAFGPMIAISGIIIMLAQGYF